MFSAISLSLTKKRFTSKNTDHIVPLNVLVPRPYAISPPSKKRCTLKDSRKIDGCSNLIADNEACSMHAKGVHHICQRFSTWVITFRTVPSLIRVTGESAMTRIRLSAVKIMHLILDLTLHSAWTLHDPDARRWFSFDAILTALPDLVASS